MSQNIHRLKPGDRSIFQFHHSERYGVNLLMQLQAEGLECSEIHLRVNGVEIAFPNGLSDINASQVGIYLDQKILVEGENCLEINNQSNHLLLLSDPVFSRFYVDEQEKSFWCWAAVTVALIRHYRAANIPSQSELSEWMSDRDAASGTASPNSDRPRLLHHVLEPFGCLAKAVPETVSLECLRKELNYDRPVAAALRAYGTNQGHLVVITGIIEYETLVVWNSKSPRYSYVHFNDFKDNYLKGYTWVNTFLTCAPLVM